MLSMEDLNSLGLVVFVSVFCALYAYDVFRNVLKYIGRISTSLDEKHHD